MGSFIKTSRLIEMARRDWDRRAKEYATRDGRAARRLGLPITRCPPYKDNDLVVSWRMGWRWEDEDIRNRRTKP